MKENDECLIVQNVTKWNPGEKPAFQNLTFHLSKGESMLLVGSGEENASALFSALTGAEPVNEGKVIYGGKRSIIPEQFPVLPGMTVTEYAMLPFLLEHKGRREAEKLAAPWLEGSMLVNKRSMRADMMRTLDRCLLLLVMAFSVRPELLLMGDCTKALTEEEKHVFWNEMRRYRKGHPAAFLCVSGSASIPYSFDRYAILQEETRQMEEAAGLRIRADQGGTGKKL